MAKINLGLDVVRKREDGYHEVRMIMQTIRMYDSIELTHRIKPGIQVMTNLRYLPVNEDNLVYRAAKLLMDEFQIREGVLIRLEKFIPVAAGMAGGSADGAAVIAALNDIFSAGLTLKELCAVGVKVGADVPFCLTGGTCVAQNIGEILSPLPDLTDCRIVLAKAERGVSTKEAYAAFDTTQNIRHLDTCGMLYAASQGDLYEMCRRCKNIFEQLIEVPERVPIKSVLNRYGALAACMSGSGPTVYGIFDDESKAECAAESLKSIVKQVYVTKPVKSGLEKIL